MNLLRPLPFVLFGLVVSQYPVIGCAELANRKETLEGHHSIFLSVNIPEAEEAAQRLGLKKESLERFLIDRLQKGGIAASLEYVDQTLILEIQVDLLKVIQAEDSDVYAFISQFEAIQPAQLGHEPEGGPRDNLAVNAIRCRQPRATKRCCGTRCSTTWSAF